MMPKQHDSRLYAAFLALLLLLAGCGKKDVMAPPFPTDSIGRNNRWIYDSLKRYYYWSDDIPGKPDYAKSPDAFFASLLSAHDRFSWVSNGADIPPASNSYFTYGFHYAFVQVAGLDGLLGVVTAVNSGGAADRAGFKRGSYFLTVNGQKVTAQNIDIINAQMNGGTSIRITPAVDEDNGWKPSAEVTLLSGFNYENAVQYTRTFSASGITTGYL